MNETGVIWRKDTRARPLLLLALLDVTPRPTVAEKPEQLGNVFTAGALVDDRGLPAQEYVNETLKRNETWHLAEGGEWFLKRRDGLYVLAASNGTEWITQPAERLELRGGAWKRVRRR